MKEYIFECMRHRCGCSRSVVVTLTDRGWIGSYDQRGRQVILPVDEPPIPSGWAYIMGRYICPEHDILLKDGKMEVTKNLDKDQHFYQVKGLEPGPA